MNRVMVCFMIMSCCVMFCEHRLSAGEVLDGKGEVLTYTIRKFGVKAGEAVIENKGMVDLGGAPRVLITFSSKGFNFFDHELIFADPHTLLPVRVERDLNIFGKKEKIIEFYDQEKYTVTIRKYKGEEMVDEIVFQKDQPIDNLYCYIYRYRAHGRFAQGEKLGMHLPTKIVNFEIVRQEQIVALGRKNEAWFMRSTPNEYQVWFDAGDQKLPLRIDGAVGLAKTVMVLEGYEQGRIE